MIKRILQIISFTLVALIFFEVAIGFCYLVGGTEVEDVSGIIQKKEQFTTKNSYKLVMLIRTNKYGSQSFKVSECTYMKYDVGDRITLSNIDVSQFKQKEGNLFIEVLIIIGLMCLAALWLVACAAAEFYVWNIIEYWERPLKIKRK